MAIQEANKTVGKLLETGYKTLSKMEFYIDSVDDLENLPDENDCLAGSKAIDAETGDVYMMNTAGEWNKIFDSEGPSEGGEESSEGSPSIVFINLIFDNDTSSLCLENTSYKDIDDYVKSGVFPVLKNARINNTVMFEVLKNYSIINDKYTVIFGDNASNGTFEADNETDTLLYKDIGG